MTAFTRTFALCVAAVLGCFALPKMAAQSAYASPPAVQANMREERLAAQLETINSTLKTTRKLLEQSQRQITELQAQLDEVRRQVGGNVPPGAAEASSSSMESLPPQVGTGAPTLGERVETVEAQVKQHDQIKVESASKYPVRVTGLVLFNGFLNHGTVDNIDLPAIATRQAAGVSNGSAGATMRQTIFGIEANGPRLGGARTSASLSLDFFGGIPYSNYGTSAGMVRMRTAGVKLDWARDTVEFAMTSPLISPLSPTSYATVAEPGMSWAGNLWTWSPQLRYAHRHVIDDRKSLQVELGLWDPPSAGYNSSDTFRVASAGEQTKQPAYEGRVSLISPNERGLQAGVGGYYSRQSYGAANNDGWAVTGDFRIPFRQRFELSGEAYRGRSLGGLGGGVYKDVVTGTNPLTGQATIRGLNAIGGWAQWKTRLPQMMETNVTMGQDNGYAGDFHAVILPPAAGNTALRARNRMLSANLIYRPKTYLIFSPEYRRIWTWPIAGRGNTADVFTLSVGYEF
jgi:hypothetical protein